MTACLLEVKKNIVLSLFSLFTGVFYFENYHFSNNKWETSLCFTENANYQISKRKKKV